MLDQSRASTALAFGVPPDGVYFAPDRLTAINWALTAAHSTHPRLVVSAVEDLMVLRTADHLAATALTPPPQTVAVDRAGRVDLDQLTALLSLGEPPGQAWCKASITCSSSSTGFGLTGSIGCSAANRR